MLRKIEIPEYLQPYLAAAQRHGGGFESLLWANPRTQAVRFAALARWCEFQGRVLLDAGCGRADLLDYLLEHGIQPAKYIGVEAVPPLADAAEQKAIPLASIIRGDFLRQTNLLNQNAHTIVFCGSLNTLSATDFYRALAAAWPFAAEQLAFNFLCSPRLASGKHLTWHHITDVVKFVSAWTGDITVDDGYRQGDCTVVARKR